MHDKAGGAARASAPVVGAAADMDDALQLFDEMPPRLSSIIQA